MNFKITAYSTALFSTWINLEELNLLFDAGDGVSAGLLQKARKVKHVFITHPDRDHLNGLPQFIQLNSREDFPVIHFPKDSGSFPAMQQFLSSFDPHVAGSRWVGIEDGQVINIKTGFQVEALRNEHIPCATGIHKSLSYKVYETREKLKQAFRDLNPKQIQEIVSERGRESLTETHRRNVLSFSGDTPVDNYDKWDGSEILIHEATFMKSETEAQVQSKGNNKHSTLEEVLQMVKEIRIGKLILTHFSSRYSHEEISHAVRKYSRELKIDIPVFIVYPGEIHRDILKAQPINA